ncbi:hypothetical protein SAMN05216511_1001 [Streptomyces sp. KS_16]|nr:hypothetical protein SAMN05216511_1001 [Streptomyces sp. KS_16]
MFTVDLPLRHQEAGEPAAEDSGGPPDDAAAADGQTAEDDRGGLRCSAGKERHA